MKKSVGMLLKYLLENILMRLLFVNNKVATFPLSLRNERGGVVKHAFFTFH